MHHLAFILSYDSTLSLKEVLEFKPWFCAVEAMIEMYQRLKQMIGIGERVPNFGRRSFGPGISKYGNFRNAVACVTASA
jgi:hypothetical protein